MSTYIIRRILLFKDKRLQNYRPGLTVYDNNTLDQPVAHRRRL